VRSTASARREDAWLAGGAVRDLLLGRPTSDLDIVVSGDAGDFADALAAKHGVAARRHARFGTATLTLSTAARIDVARPRRETYARPGALPSVSVPATLEEDLARRDFTIHAMALPLRARQRPGLVDPFGGRADLAAKRIRVLHDRSFLDDPTRAYRAARYASRLGFRVDPAAARLVRQAVAAGAVDAVSGDRLGRELGLIVSEPARAGSVALLSRLGLDTAITPALSRPGAAVRLRAAAAAASRLGVVAVGPLCYLLAWMGDAPPESLVEAADRLALAGPALETWLAWPQTRARGERFAGLPLPERRRRVRGLTGDIAAAVAATLPTPDRAAWTAAMRAPGPELRIRGRDLVAAGVPPGPRVGTALARTLEAREEGRIGADQELEFALEAARLAGDAAS
jgi:tRNA nucleotidyltransferase (CCA-adding enzyme)